MLQHYRGNLDNWDPALTDALAGDRESRPTEVAADVSTFLAPGSN